MIDDADSIDGIDFDAYPIEAEEKTLTAEKECGENDEANATQEDGVT